MAHVRIPDPTGRADVATGAGIEVRPRPRQLGGTRVGLLDNGKPNAAVCLGGLGDALHRRHEVSYVPLSKAVSSQPCPEDLLVRFSGFDAAVVGVGD